MGVTPLHVNLGIDFGTSYTKVCYRDLGSDKSGVLTFEGEPYLPSIVRVDDDGALSTAIGSSRRGSTEIAYLKMLIGVDAPAAMYVRALSSYYLAETICGAKREFIRQETELTEGRPIIWSSNIGVPVEHYDSPKVDIFREVFAIAWRWAESNNVPTSVGDTIDRYKNDRMNTAATDCHAVPEIVAAVWSFVTSREARPGIYTYLDVGGGTLDGVCFRYENDEGDRRICCYSAKVGQLGVSSLSEEADVEEKVLTADELPPRHVYNQLEKYANEIQTLVGQIIVTAKSRIPGGFMGNSLPIFIGGGGAHSEWYQTAIMNTYWSRQHYNIGIPWYEMMRVPEPSDLEMNSAHEGSFPRFTIAYGLSVPAGEAPDFSLPSSAPQIIPHAVQKWLEILSNFEEANSENGNDGEKLETSE